MEELFKDKYRIKSARLKDWDYSQEGYYYITICTKNREPFFGKIINNKVNLSEIGKIVEKEWLKTPQIRNNIQIDEFIIMPNHFHGILIIDYKYPVETSQSNVSSDEYTIIPNHTHEIVAVNNASTVETPRSNVSSDEYTITPNHTHEIVGVNNASPVETPRSNVSSDEYTTTPNHTHEIVGVNNASPVETPRSNVSSDEYTTTPNHTHEIVGVNNASPVETPRSNVSSDEYTTTPNHTHEIVGVNNASPVETPRRDVSTDTKHIDHTTNNHHQTYTNLGVSTGANHNPYHHPEWKPNSIGSIICQFKSAVTRQCNKNGFNNFKWQARYYDHIIRDEKDLNRIRRYIKNNPYNAH